MILAEKRLIDLKLSVLTKQGLYQRKERADYAAEHVKARMISGAQQHITINRIGRMSESHVILPFVRIKDTPNGREEGGRLAVGFFLTSLPCFPLEESGLVLLVFRPQASLGILSFPDFLFFLFHGTLASFSRGSSRSGSSTSWAFVGSSGSVLVGNGLLSWSFSMFFLPLHCSASAPGFGAFHGGARRSDLGRDPAPSCRLCR